MPRTHEQAPRYFLAVSTPTGTVRSRVGYVSLTGPQDGAGANIKHSVRTIALDSRESNPYKNLNTARKFYECCKAHLSQRTVYEWASEGDRVEYEGRYYLFISQDDVGEEKEIPRDMKTWVPPAGKKGTHQLHGVQSTGRSLHIQVGKIESPLDIFK